MNPTQQKDRPGSLVEPETVTETDNLNPYTKIEAMRQAGRRAGFSHISEVLPIVMDKLLRGTS